MLAYFLYNYIIIYILNAVLNAEDVNKLKNFTKMHTNNL